MGITILSAALVAANLVVDVAQAMLDQRVPLD